MDSSRFRMIEGRHIAAFITVAEELHFSRAANRLGMTQPRLSVLLHRLEDLVGARLFDRRPEVRLTAEGQAALPHFQAALGRLQAGVDLLERRRRGVEGTLRVGFPTWVLGTDIPDRLVEFRRAFPDVAVDLFDYGTTAQLHELRAGTLNIGFVRTEPFADPDLAFDPMFTDPWRLVIPAHHALTNAPRVRLRDVASEPFVSFPDHLAPELQQQLQLIYRSEGVFPRISHAAREWLAIVGLVRAGGGWALVPASIEKIYASGLRYYPVGDASTATKICACTGAGSDPITIMFRDRVVADFRMRAVRSSER